MIYMIGIVLLNLIIIQHRDDYSFIFISEVFVGFNNYNCSLSSLDKE